MLDTRGIAFKVLGDSAGSEAALARMERGFGAVAGQADRSSTALLRFGKQGELTARQIQALSYQTTDIVTQLVSGQQPLMVLLQQGGQLRDQFGSVTNIFRAFSQVLTPVRLALGGVAGAAIAVGAGFALGHQESAEFRKQMALTGNAAGTTAGDVDTLAASLAELSGNSIGNAREAVLELAKTGQFVGGALSAAGRAALVMQKLTGDSIDDIVKRFAGARDGVAKWAADANRSYNFITAAQYQYIRSLEAQGRTQEAMRVTFESLAQVMEQRQVPALGSLERGWLAVKNAVSGAWDAIKGIGRDTTLEDQLERVRQRIGAGEGSANPYFKRFTLPKLRDEQAYLQEQLRVQRAGADRAAAQARDEQKAIEEAGKAHQESMAAIARAGIDMRLQQQQAGFEAALSATERAYQRFEISGQQYRDRTSAALRGQLDAEKAALQAQLSLEQQRVVEKPADEHARSAAVLQILTRIAQVEAKRAELNRKIAEFQAAVPAARNVNEGPQAAFRTAEIAQQNAVEQATRERSLEAQRAVDELLERNQALTADLILDERARGEALIRIDVENQRKRLMNMASTAEEAKAIAEQLAQYELNLQKRLTEQLKPEWQRRLDAWSDPMRAAKEAQDQFMNETMRTGEDAWTAMVTQGRSFAKTLKSVIEQELARIGWRKFLAEPFARVMEYIAKAIGSVVGGGFGAFGGGGGLTEFGGMGAPAYHGGGIAGAGGSMRSVSPLVFAGARRYHSGGLAGNEIPAILQRGEEVLKRSDPRHVLNGGGQTVVYNVPPGYSPAAYAATLEQNNRRLKAEMYNDLSRPGRPLYHATRR